MDKLLASSKTIRDYKVQYNVIFKYVFRMYLRRSDQMI